MAGAQALMAGAQDTQCSPRRAAQTEAVVHIAFYCQDSSLRTCGQHLVVRQRPRCARRAGEVPCGCAIRVEAHRILQPASKRLSALHLV